MQTKPLTDLIEKELKDFLVEKVVSALLGKVGILAWGPLPAITKFFVEKIVVELMGVAVMATMIAYIRFDIDNDVKNLSDVLEEMKRRIAEKELTDEEIKELDDKLADVSIDLIRFNRLRDSST